MDWEFIVLTTVQTSSNVVNKVNLYKIIVRLLSTFSLRRVDFFPIWVSNDLFKNILFSCRSCLSFTFYFAIGKPSVPTSIFLMLIIQEITCYFSRNRHNTSTLLRIQDHNPYGLNCISDMLPFLYFTTL